MFSNLSNGLHGQTNFCCPDVRDPSARSALRSHPDGIFPTLAECQGIWQHVNSLVASNETCAAELIACLSEVHHADMQQLRRGYLACCWPEVRAYAHRIKSTAQLSGATSVATLCQQVESLVDQGDVHNLVATAELFLTSAQRLSAALSAWVGGQGCQRS